MKEMGVNAIRTSHEPILHRKFLDLCDRMGLVVLDEAFDEWTKAKVDNGLSTCILMSGVKKTLQAS